MTHMLTFSRNRCTGVEQVDDQTIRSYCRLQDTLTDAYVEITARLPDLDITGVKGEIQRGYRETPEPDEFLQKVIGVRIGPGMLEIIKGLLGDSPDYEELGFMVEECCHGVILSLTKGTLLRAPRNTEDRTEFFSAMVKENIRLYNRCAAFAPGSLLVEGITPPE
ncbi:hypothetical protein QUF80_14005 [Desulfococcaceae bacterium HSG8]|nr:hypothetical protein [Desulfococcaceae bacterium HSG8]